MTTQWEAEVLPKLQRATRGTKGNRPDYLAMLSTADATVIAAELARLRTALTESKRERDEAREMFEATEHARAQLSAAVARLTGELEAACEVAGCDGEPERLVEAVMLIRDQRDLVAGWEKDIRERCLAAEATLTALRGKLEQMPGVEIQGTLYIREDRVRAALATITPSDTGSQR
ncbi:MAG: hypothetical protein ACYC3F_16850 [Gemmatimonadaceae bacterium]